MVDRGLHTSLWADKRNGGEHNTNRFGDWTCPACGFSNFQRRTECFRCSSKPTNNAIIHDPGVRSGYDSPNMILPPQELHSQPTVNDHQEVPGASGAYNPQICSQSHTKQSPRINNGQNGLYTSRWARRDSIGNAKLHDVREVWTKVVSRVNVVPMSRTNNIPSPTIMAPDLGLPYEVQHYILAMMQRILEAACYDFASRWIPHILNENTWTCSEAVELSTWKRVLPSAVAPNAIVPMKNYSLENALSDAVRIRNSAVHRHLCDNIEMQRMASQAQDLMSMFSDITRQAKFHRLQDELADWDAAAQDDMQVSRSKLQAALQVISEQPVDDMDWTPNAVSLEEIIADVEPDLGDDDYYDVMEVD